MKINVGKDDTFIYDVVILRIRENYETKGFTLGVFLRIGIYYIQLLCRNRKEVYIWMIVIMLLILLKIVL